MTETPTLAQLQRWAASDAKRLGIIDPVSVHWGGEAGGDGLGGRACEFPVVTLAHAHVREVKRTGVARICIRRRLSARTARETIRHEVAHFAPGGTSHGWSHIEAQAQVGSKAARTVLVRHGRVRCPKHDWLVRTEKSRKVTAAGLVTVASAVCRRCRKTVG